MSTRTLFVSLSVILLAATAAVAQDTEAPTVSGTPTVTPNEIDLSGGMQTVTVSFVGEDNDAGMTQAFGVFINDAGFTGSFSLTLASGTAQNGTWQGESQIPAYALDGVYDLSLTLFDGASNVSTPSFADLLTITGGDQIVPELVGQPTVSHDTLFVPDNATFTDIDTVVVTAHVTDEGTGVTEVLAQLMAADGLGFSAGLCDLISGDENDGMWRCEILVFLINLNTPESPDRLGLSMFVADDAFNNETIDTGIELVVARGKSPVSFRVDMKRMERIGLFDRGGFLDERMDIYVDILNGPEAGQYPMRDVLFDSVFAADVSVTPMDGLQYAFAIDPDGDGQNLGDWVYERPGNPRTIDISTSGQLDVVPFDDLPIGGEEIDFAAQVTLNLPSGQSGPLVFNTDVDETAMSLDFGSVTTPALISVRRFTENPGGTPPGGIVNVSSGQRWVVDVVPTAAPGQTEVGLTYDGLGGISEPASLRLLRRDGPGGAWQNLSTNVETGASTLSATSNVPGEFTLGSTTAANSLVPDPPDPATQPFPSDGARSFDISSSLSWTPDPNALTFDVYLWQEEFGESEEPLAERLTQPTFSPPPFYIERGESYVWYVVSRNLDGEVAGPRWTFSTELEPDLALSDVVVPSEGFSGREIELEWVVTNVSDVPTNVPSWTDVIHFSDDPSFVLDFETLGRVQNPSALPPGEQYVQTATVRLPDEAFGSWYIQIVANGDNFQRERDRSNNAQVLPIEIDRSPLPDLAITDISVPPNAFSGAELQVEWTITNEGPGDAASDFGWNDILFLTDDPNAPPTFDRVAARSFRQEPLASGGSYTLSKTIKVPARASGTWYVVAQTNDNRTVYEGDATANNLVASGPIQITLSPPPDLMPGAIAGPTGAVAGQEIDIEWSVTNSGPGPVASGTWNDRLYLVAAGQADEPILLTTRRQRGPLDPDSSYTASVTVRVPDGLGGDYVLRVESDWANTVFEHTFEENNSSELPIEIQRPPYPDLSVVSIDQPAQGRAGSEILLTWSVENVGDGSLAGAWTDRIYVSGSAEFDTNAVPILTNPTSLALAPSAAYDHSQRVILPVTMQGSLFIHVVADDDNSVFEYPDDTANNVRSGAIEVAPYPPVDLAVVNVSVPGQARAGETVRVEWSVENSGEAAATDAVWDDVIYLSADSNLDAASDAVLARVRRAEGLAAGSSYRKSTMVDIPVAASGPLNLLVHAEVADSDDGNNVGAAANRIQVSSAPAADLRVVSIDAPSTAVAGQPITMTVVVANNGPEPVTGEWIDAVYLSDDRSIQPGDFPLGTVRRSAPLGVGDQYQFDLEVNVPSFVTGTRILVVSADDGRSIFEGLSEGNNTMGHEITVTLAPPSDLVVSNITAPETAIPGQETTIEWTLTNQGGNRAQGWLEDAVYISADAIWHFSDPLVGTQEQLIDLAPGSSTVITSKVDLSSSLEVDAQGNVTGSLPGVPPGSYIAIVRTDIRNSIRETDDKNNATAAADSIRVDVENLPLGGSVSGRLLPGQSRYYKVELPGEVETIELSLSADDDNSSNELYVSDGVVPTLSIADVIFAEPFASSFDLAVPRTSYDRTTHYVMLFGRDGVEAGTDFTLSAEALQFELDAIDLEQGGEGGDVTIRMSGAALSNQLRAYLENEQISIQAHRVVVANTSEIYATFDLRGVPLGGYDVVLEKDQSSLHLAADSLEIIQIDELITRSILPQAFAVVPKVASEPFVESTVPDVVLIDSEFRVLLEVTNHGNVDMVSPLVFFMTSPATYASIHPEEDPTAGYKQVVMTGEAPVAGTLRPGRTSSLLVEVVSPPTGGALRVYAGLAKLSGEPFDLITELERAGLNDPGQAWASAIVELSHELEGAGWRTYEERLAEAASDLSESNVIQRDGSKLLLQVLLDILQSQAAPAWAGDSEASSSYLEEAAKNYSVADPCTGIGSLPLPGVDCGPGQILADKTALTCVAAGLAAPQICGGTHGAEHLLHFLNGDGSPRIYDDTSELAAKLRSHPGQKSFEDISRDVSEKVQREMLDRIKDLDCENIGELADDDLIPMDELGIDVEKPKTYLDPACEQIPYYDPLQDDLPSFEDLRAEQPGCDLVTAFGGFQSAMAYMWDIQVSSSPGPQGRRCDKPGCRIEWSAKITYRFGDKYEFDAGDAQLSDFDRRARNLQLCGEAKPFDSEVILHEPIGGIVHLPPKRRECPEPPDLPPFLFEPPEIVPVITSFDPNDIVGPAGAGDERWVSVSETLPYTIRFENDAERATAPAQVVSIEQVLPDSTLDVRSFRLGEFGFGDFSFQPPQNAASYSEQLDLSDSLGIVVDVNAGLDVIGNRVFWILRTLDPATGRAPSNPLSGFLPVNDTLGSGEGFVSYTIRPNPSASTGDVILAKADIVFDSNEIIETPEIFNTIDAGLPGSFIRESPVRVDTTMFELTFGGRDDPGGSGVERFDLYVSKDGGPFELYREKLTNTGLIFNAEYNHRYLFYTLASDRAGNREPATGKTGRLIIVGTETETEIPEEFSLGQNYPNPFNPSTTVPYALPESADVEMTVYTMLGQRVLRYKMDSQRAGLHSFRVDLQELSSGVYFYRLEARNSSRVLFSDTKKMVLVK